LRAPSLLTADPRITAWIVSWSRTASSSRLSTTMPAPSDGTVPVDVRSKLRQCPSSEKIPPGSYRYPRRVGGATVAPPASARSASKVSRLCTARWTATSEVEHADWTLSEGPRRFSL
jgi:hypothetical protein